MCQLQLLTSDTVTINMPRGVQKAGILLGNVAERNRAIHFTCEINQRLRTVVHSGYNY